MVRTAATTSRVALGEDRWRTTKVENTYDRDTGLLTKVYDHGDIADPGQATCTTTTYAPANAANNLTGLPAEVETVAAGCDEDAQRPADVIADVRTYYDDPDTWKATPTAGDAVRVEQASGYAGGRLHLHHQDDDQLRLPRPGHVGPRCDGQHHQDGLQPGHRHAHVGDGDQPGEPADRDHPRPGARAHHGHRRRERQQDRTRLRRAGPAHRGVAARAREGDSDGQPRLHVPRVWHSTRRCHHPDAHRGRSVQDQRRPVRRDASAPADPGRHAGRRTVGQRHVLRLPRLGAEDQCAVLQRGLRADPDPVRGQGPRRARPAPGHLRRAGSSDRGRVAVQGRRDVAYDHGLRR